MPSLEPEEARRRFGTGSVAYLATLRTDGSASLVPIVFDTVGDRIVSSVDPKPKRTSELARLRHIARDPRVAVLVDHYEDDWERIWWARAEGVARIVGEGEEREEAIAQLRARYPQYAMLDDAFGEAVIIEVTRWTGWSAT